MKNTFSVHAAPGLLTCRSRGQLLLRKLAALGAALCLAGPIPSGVLASSFVDYTNIGQVYIQDFDALPNPGLISVPSANPVTIAGVTYNLSNYFDFAAPVRTTDGGLGIETLAGWYAAGSITAQTGAQAGDQTKGGLISFGPTNSVMAAGNRSLGLLASSSSGTTVFAARIVNHTGAMLTNMDLSFTSELWRQTPNAKTVAVWYYIDPTGAAPFNTNKITAPLTNIIFATAAVSYGTNGPLASAAMGFTGIAIQWPANAALWFFWRMTSDASSSQGIGIDNFQFAVPSLAPVILTEPQSQEVTAGSSAAFSVVISNSYGATFQWFTNGVPLEEGGDFSGARASALTINPARLSDSATYTVLVSNVYGTGLSDGALLTVSSAPVKPSFTLQPQSATNFIGDTVILTNFAMGDAPIFYQWQFDGTNLPGAVNAGLVLSNVTAANAGNYDVIASNSGGTNLSATAVLTILAAPPVITNPPVSQAVAEGDAVFFSVGVKGAPPFTYQWLHDGTNLISINEFVGATSNILEVANASLADDGSYTVMVTGPGGGPVASAPATLIVLPPPSFVAYTNLGQVYTQNFDALPDPGLISVPSDNPVTIDDVTYNLADPFDFAFPVLSANGGLGIDGLAGWFGAGSLAAQLGAQSGDQTKGGVISFGPTNSLMTASNRSLGLLATSSSGTTAFGVRIVNQTGTALSKVTLAFTAELWRQTSNAKTVAVSYYIDPSGVAAFNTNNITERLTNIAFATGSTSWGTNRPVASANVSFSGLPLDWPANAALWFVWNMTSNAGSSQGIGIDDLTFSAAASATSVSLTIIQSGPNVVIDWPASAGTNLQVNADLTQPTHWTAVAQPISVNGQTNSVSVPLGPANQFFRLAQP